MWNRRDRIQDNFRRRPVFPPRDYGLRLVRGGRSTPQNRLSRTPLLFLSKACTREARIVKIPSQRGTLNREPIQLSHRGATCETGDILPCNREYDFTGGICRDPLPEGEKNSR